MATKVTPIQVLRSEILNKRPDPAKLLDGQPSINFNAAQPGFFFRDDTGNSLIKIGPCTVGPAAPNTNDPYWANPPSPSAPGNTLGELWLDTTSTFDRPGPALRVWNGTSWIDCLPYRYANTIVSDTAPVLSNHLDGTLWWDSGTGLMYVLYNDGTSRQWTQVSSNTVA
jgi:hypothetical protein